MTLQHGSWDLRRIQTAREKCSSDNHIPYNGTGNPTNTAVEVLTLFLVT